MHVRQLAVLLAAIWFISAGLVAQTAPTFVSQPNNMTVKDGGALSFSLQVTTSNASPVTWKLNLPGRTLDPFSTASSQVNNVITASVAFAGLHLSDAGSFQIVATNAYGSTSSEARTLTVTPSAPIAIISPTLLSAIAGTSVSFSVTATGTAPFIYQWRKNGSPIAGATTATLTFSNVQISDAGSYTVTVTNSIGSITSSPATLAVALGAPPTITTQPVSQSQTVGGNVTLSVSVSGTGPFSYQWQKNGAAVTGGTAATLALTNVQLSDAGTYTVTVTTAAGTVTSDPATLTITPPVLPPVASPPSITTQPLGQALTAGASVTFSVVATGTAPLTFQWRRNGAVIAGATTSSLPLTSVQVGDSGEYTVTVSNAAGSVTSNVAVLDVAPAGPSAWLSNLSVRTALPAGQSLIVGVVVSGGQRDLLVRAAGPVLSGFGITTAMADPRLELYNDRQLVFENDDWPGNLAATFSSVSAFPFAAGSRDAAMVQPVDGSRSIQVRGSAGGVVLVEVYDLGTSNSPRLVNVSARNRVGTGDDILIAGFNVAGSGSKQLLVRAVGPKLAAFGVTGALVDPKLEIYTAGGAKLTENDNWSASLGSLFTAIGAFPLDADSRDAALVTTAAPGSYTVQVRGADGGTGEALVEIYEVP